MENKMELNPELELELESLKEVSGGTKILTADINQGGQMIKEGMIKAKKSGMNFDEFMSNTWFGQYFRINHPGQETVVKSTWDKLGV